MNKITMAALAVFALGGVTEATGQVQVTGQASVTIPEVLMIQSVGDLTIGAGAFDFSGSDTAEGQGLVTVETRANVTHALEVSGSDLTHAGGGTLALEVWSGAAWEFINGGAVRALSGLVSGTQSEAVTFRATAGVTTHEPGEYTGTITYTVILDN